MGVLDTLRGIAVTGRISVPTAVDGLLGRIDRGVCDARLDWWAKKLLRDAEVDLDVRGREHAEGDEPFIVMSNHQSLYDVPVLYQVVPGSLRMVAKSELFQVPIWGHAMAAAGFIRVDRNDRQQAVESLKTSSSMLQRGARIWIAPEGTRSRTGAVGRFKSGGFRMAMETGTRILPIAIDGTRHVLPARGLWVQPGKHVTVTIFPPVDPRRYTEDERKVLMEHVRSTIAGALEGKPADGAEARIRAA